MGTRKSCDGKIRHANELAAQYYIAQDNRQGTLDYYPCKYCGGWHVFTIPGMKKLSDKKSRQFNKENGKLGPRKMRINGRGRNGHK